MVRLAMRTSKGAKGTLDEAKKELQDQIAAGTSGTSLEPFQTAVTNAQEAYDKAKAEFDAISMGPVYQAGVDEWMAKAAVTDAIAAYNKAVTAIEGDTGGGGDHSGYPSGIEPPGLREVRRAQYR